MRFKPEQLVKIIRTGNIVSAVRYVPDIMGLPIVIVETDRWGDNMQFAVYEKDLEEIE